MEVLLMDKYYDELDEALRQCEDILSGKLKVKSYTSVEELIEEYSIEGQENI